MTDIQVKLGDRSYAIHIEAGALDRAGELLRPFARRDRFVIIT
ncbi:MAG: 3-dehydroquinate synthase, partial [Rhizorhabdus sp.]|nr:3-dehydroquinate synthase [Rhizorhabdus sp.]